MSWQGEKRMRMNKHIKRKRGFQTLEAAIFLPVFLIAVLTFGYLIKMAAVQENIMHIMTDEVRRLSMTSYNIKVAPLFKDELCDRLEEENRLIENLKVDRFWYLYGKNDLISITVSCKVKNILPKIFYDDFMLEEKLLARGFTGKKNLPEKTEFNEMEMEEESRTVWVFPVAGERYHEEKCGYINVAAREIALDHKTRRRYDPCTHCNPGELENGSLAYCFERAGKVYHKGSCYIVERYVISMEEKDAQSKGYGPCSKCIG